MTCTNHQNWFGDVAFEGSCVDYYLYTDVVWIFTVNP